jgi:hypothetical protein
MCYRVVLSCLSEIVRLGNKTRTNDKIKVFASKYSCQNVLFNSPIRNFGPPLDDFRRHVHIVRDVI